MRLITEEEAKAALASSGPQKKAAILIFNGVQIIDFTGPYEIFGSAGFEVYTVAGTTDPIITSMGMTVVPRYSFANAPLPDVLVVPGGAVRGAEGDSATINWIKDENARIQHTMSVCNGAFILAHAGLLNGLSATTTDGNIPRLREQFPQINVVDNERFVDNGKIITTAGLSAGIDGALHVISLMLGRGIAEEVALGEEYHWQESGREFVRASLADKLIPIGNLPAELGRWIVERTHGGTDRWELVLRGTSDKTVIHLKKYFENECATKGNWILVKPLSDGSSEWKLADRNGKTWRGNLKVQRTQGKKNEYTVNVKVAKG